MSNGCKKKRRERIEQLGSAGIRKTTALGF
jgi:hypothetical protein